MDKRKLFPPRQLCHLTVGLSLQAGAFVAPLRSRDSFYIACYLLLFELVKRRLMQRLLR